MALAAAELLAVAESRRAGWTGRARTGQPAALCRTGDGWDAAVARPVALDERPPFTSLTNPTNTSETGAA